MKSLESADYELSPSSIEDHLTRVELEKVFQDETMPSPEDLLILLEEMTERRELDKSN